MFRVDLHTHSSASPDGGVTPAQYRRVLETGILDVIAITDHNRIDMAQAVAKELGERIIVGEEVMTTAGEIIGLYLTEAIQSGMSLQETVDAIKSQGGLVYIPHPFETVRKGLHPHDLETVLPNIDIIEVCNGRAYVQNKSQQTVVWSRLNHVVGAASSDAHGYKGLGRTFSNLGHVPTRENLVELLQTATLNTSRAPIRSLLYPKYHRVRKRVKRAS